MLPQWPFGRYTRVEGSPSSSFPFSNSRLSPDQEGTALDTHNMDHQTPKNTYHRISCDEIDASTGGDQRPRKPHFIFNMGNKTQELPESHSSEHVERLRPIFKAASNSWIRWWLPEILASVLSAGAFILLIVLLRSSNGQLTMYTQNPKILGDIISLNGLAALLASISKAALMVPVGSSMSQDVWLWLSEMK